MRSITICIPVYNEEKIIHSLLDEVDSVIGELKDYHWTYLFVDDGSSDGTWEVLSKLSDQRPDVQAINLSRNFGKELALTAAIESIGEVDAVITLDADLQHPPAKIPSFLEAWENGAEVVIGIRKEVADYTLLKRVGAKAFYTLFQCFSDVELVRNTTDFRLLDKQVVEELCRFPERSRMFRGLIDWLGFKRVYVEFSAPKRSGGRETYSTRKLVDLAINSLASFSIVPLRLTTYFGFMIWLLSIGLLLIMVLTEAMHMQHYTTQAYFVVFIVFLVGIVLFVLGLLAVYLGQIHTEVVGRPLYVIRKRAGISESDCRFCKR